MVTLLTTGKKPIKLKLVWGTNLNVFMHVYSIHIHICIWGGETLEAHKGPLARKHRITLRISKTNLPRPTQWCHTRWHDIVVNHRILGPLPAADNLSKGKHTNQVSLQIRESEGSHSATSWPNDARRMGPDSPMTAEVVL